MRVARITVGGVVVGLLCWLALAQGTDPGPVTDEPQEQRGESPAPQDGLGWREASAGLSADWDAASALANAEQHEPAARRYQEILAQLPASTQAQKASVRAAACLTTAAKPLEAIEMYDRAFAVGKELLVVDYYNPTGHEWKPAPIGKRSLSIKHWMEVALYNKALACRQAQDAATGIQTIETLRVEFPKSRYVPELASLWCEFQGLPPQQASQLAQDEQDAAQLFNEPHEAFLRKEYDTALPVLEQVVTQLGHTAVALQARADVARILWDQSEYDRARELYAEILEQGQEVAPDSHLVRLAEAKIAWVDLQPRLKNVIRGFFRGDPAPPEEAQAVYDRCLIIMSKEDEMSLRCHANRVLIQTAHFDQDYEKVVMEAKIFFRNYAGPKKQRLFASDIAWVYVHVGHAYRHLGSYDEALDHFHAITGMWEADPERWAGKKVIPAAHYGIVLTLREAGASGTDVQVIEDIIHADFPQSNYSKLLRMGNR